MGDFNVIFTCRNSEKIIEASLTSLIEQSIKPKHIIVVDDGSTDSTSLVVQKFEGKVHLISQENQGAAVARQVGTEASTSDYIAYLDADDWWPEDRNARCREIITNENVDCLFADLQRSMPGDAPGKYLPRNITYYPWAKEYIKRCAVNSGVENFYKLEASNGLLFMLRGFPMYPSTLLVRRSVIDAVGGWDSRFRRCQDFDIILRIARRYPLHYLDEVTAIIGIHDVNKLVYQYVVMQTEGDIKVLLAHFESEPVGSVYRRQVAETLARKYCSLGHHHRNACKFKLSKQSYLKALLWPGCKIKSIIHFCLCSIHCVCNSSPKRKGFESA